MIGSVTMGEWGARFQLQTIRQAQAAMTKRLAIKQLNERSTEITNAHHIAMKHSVRTGRNEYDREDETLRCDDDEMERQWIMCNYIHDHQWGLEEARVRDKPVEDLQQKLDDCFATMQQSLKEKIEELFRTMHPSHGHSRPDTQSGHSSTQDEQASSSGTEEVDWDQPIEDTSMLGCNDWEWGLDSSQYDEPYDTSVDEGSDSSSEGELCYIPVFYYATNQVPLQLAMETHQNRQLFHTNGRDQHFLWRMRMKTNWTLNPTNGRDWLQ